MIRLFPVADVPVTTRSALLVTRSILMASARPTIPPARTFPEGLPVKVTWLPSSPKVSFWTVIPVAQPMRPAIGYLSRSTVQLTFLMVQLFPLMLYFSGMACVPAGTHSLMEEASISFRNLTTPSTRNGAMDPSPLTALAKATRSSAVAIPRRVTGVVPSPAAWSRETVTVSFPRLEMVI